MYEPLRDTRIQFRIKQETYWRLKYLSMHRKITMTKLIEQFIDDAWMDQIALPGFGACRRPE